MCWHAFQGACLFKSEQALFERGLDITRSSD